MKKKKLHSSQNIHTFNKFPDPLIVDLSGRVGRKGTRCFSYRHFQKYTVDTFTLTPRPTRVPTSYPCFPCMCFVALRGCSCVHQPRREHHRLLFLPPQLYYIHRKTSIQSREAWVAVRGWSRTRDTQDFRCKDRRTSRQTGKETQG